MEAEINNIVSPLQVWAVFYDVIKTLNCIILL